MPRIIALAAALGAASALAAPPGSPLDFDLPGPGGFVRLAELPPRVTLVNFWRADCPPCVRELPLLNRHAATHPELRVVAIALQTPGESESAAQRPLPPVLALHGPRQPQGLLARFGNRAGALPHTVMLDAHRRPCARRTGEIDAAWRAAASRACAA